MSQDSKIRAQSNPTQAVSGISRTSELGATIDVPSGYDYPLVNIQKAMENGDL